MPEKSKKGRPISYQQYPSIIDIPYIIIVCARFFHDFVPGVEQSTTCLGGLVISKVTNSIELFDDECFKFS